MESQYEVLRQAGAQGPVLPECRNGLALFLRKGMWGWWQDVKRVQDVRELNQSTGMKTGREEQAPLVQLFAALVLNSLQAQGA